MFHLSIIIKIIFIWKIYFESFDLRSNQKLSNVKKYHKKSGFFFFKKLFFLAPLLEFPIINSNAFFAFFYFSYYFSYYFLYKSWLGNLGLSIKLPYLSFIKKLLFFMGLKPLGAFLLKKLFLLLLFYENLSISTFSAFS